MTGLRWIMLTTVVMDEPKLEQVICFTFSSLCCCTRFFFFFLFLLWDIFWVHFFFAVGHLYADWRTFNLFCEFVSVFLFHFSFISTIRQTICVAVYIDMYVAISCHRLTMVYVDIYSSNICMHMKLRIIILRSNGT